MWPPAHKDSRHLLTKLKDIHQYSTTIHIADEAMTKLLSQHSRNLVSRVPANA
jgi:hypothetical protein